MSKNAIVVGAGILGLATARALAEKGYQVKVIEKTVFDWSKYQKFWYDLASRTT